MSTWADELAAHQRWDGPGHEPRMEAAAAAPDGPDEGGTGAAPWATTVEVLVGEVLIRQSSGRHRAQGAVAAAVTLPVSGPWGVAVEVFGTHAAERSAELSFDQYLLRPAALLTLGFRRPVSLVVSHRASRPPRDSAFLGFDVALGPALDLTFAQWSEPAHVLLPYGEPGVRGRAGLAFGVGPHLRVRLQGGAGWRPSGLDHDYMAGAAWAF